MSAELATRPPMTQEKVELIKRTVAKGSTDDELELFIARFWARTIQETNGCLRWSGAIKSNGYGVVRFQGKLHHAHRLAVLLTLGQINPTLVIDHLCRNKWCVNPQHLEPVTKRENALRGIPGQVVEFCKRGHPLSADNVYTSGLRRTCKACARERSHNHYHFGRGLS